MALNSFALRTGLYSRLSDRLSYDVYSVVPDESDVTFPYIRIGEISADNVDTKTEDMQDYFIPLHVFSKDTESTEQVETIIGEIFDVLNDRGNFLDVSDFAVVNCSYLDHRVMQGVGAQFGDDKYIHGLTRYRITVQSYA